MKNIIKMNNLPLLVDDRSSRTTDAFWESLGVPTSNYIEPFIGGANVVFQRPGVAHLDLENVNDLSSKSKQIKE